MCILPLLLQHYLFGGLELLPELWPIACDSGVEVRAKHVLYENALVKKLLLALGDSVVGQIFYVLDVVLNVE